MKLENHDKYKTNSFAFRMSQKIENIELFTVACNIIMNKPVFITLIIFNSALQRDVNG